MIENKLYSQLLLYLEEAPCTLELKDKFFPVDKNGPQMFLLHRSL